MAKRRLTRRQQWRIKKVQDERLKRALKRDSLIDSQFDADALGPEQQGLVIAHYGTQVEVEALQGENRGTTCRCHLRTNLEQIVTGDRVVWRAAPDRTGVIVANSERTSELSRPDQSGRLRPVAANIDQIFIVIAPQPVTPPGLIDRYLVAAETVLIQPLLLINKSDLLTGEAEQTMADVMHLYRRIGYPVITTSSKSEQGLSSLTDKLHQHTSIFVGQSGVGKSSLVNTLLPDAQLRTAGLSESTGKGTHTTTTACLFHLPEGGDIIDSPGIREFGLWHIDKQQLTDGFIEFRPHLGKCKFRDCHHLNEPGCALKEAVKSGQIDARRITSYQRIAADL